MSDFAPPLRLAAGTTWTWTVDAAGDVEGQLSYIFRHAGQERLELAAAQTPNGWAVEVSYSDTDILSGDWQWFAFIQFEDRRTQVGSGALTVTPNAAAESTADLRSENEVALANIRAVIGHRATQDQKSYMIGDRQLVRIGLDELLKLERYYGRRVRDEHAASIGQAVPALEIGQRRYAMGVDLSW